MNKLSSYCGLVDAKIRASDKDLPVQKLMITMKTTLTIVPMKTLISMTSLLVYTVAQPTKCRFLPTKIDPAK